MPDPRVEKLENDIALMRAAFEAFVREQALTLRELKHGVDTVNGHVADVLMEIGTVPDHRYREADRLTVTKRLHKLENDASASQIAQEALRRTKDQAWTRGQKIGLFAFAAVGALGVLLRLVGVGG